MRMRRDFEKPFGTFWVDPKNGGSLDPNYT